MKKFSFLTLLSMTGALATARAEYAPESARIDSLVEASLQQHKIQPNPPATDEVFVRRIYPDVIGRIPTKEETTKFLNDSDPQKRSKLIDTLLENEGYVSHWFNYWADILRVKSDMDNGTGNAYAAWVKQSLATNKPYDQMVRELITADGYVWDNGAVGYYLRDAGMPLDNMSNTAQILLGTRVVCAQCHNHPFDKWTQKDYYDMAAFTYGVQTEMDPYAIFEDAGKDNKLDKAIEKVVGEKAMRKNKREGRVTPESRELREQMDEILEPLKYGVTEKAPSLKLPPDYKEGAVGYEGKANEPITKAKTLFGADRMDKPGVQEGVSEKTRAALAEWMCTKDNPRFGIVIANRLWKRAMGIGLVEPVDDFKDDTKPSNPQLMDHLTRQLAMYKYDMKKYLRMVYNTRTNQRMCTTKDVSEEDPYYFQGPVLRRMSAEQIWDSIVTLIIPNPEGRKAGTGYVKQLEDMKTKAAELQARFVLHPQGPENLVKLASAMASTGKEFQQKIQQKNAELRTAREKKDTEKEKTLQAEIQKLNDDRDNAIAKAMADTNKAIAEDAKSDPFANKPLPMDKKKAEEQMMGDKTGEKAMMENGGSAADYVGFNENYFRASELRSPMPQNHFLREFGQSDRDVIERAHYDASVTQALNLMNGQIFDDLVSDKSLLNQAMKYALTPEEKAINLWLTIYNRYPSSEERSLVVENVEDQGKDAWKGVFWAMLNSKEFIFIQ